MKLKLRTIISRENHGIDLKISKKMLERAKELNAELRYEIYKDGGFDVYKRHQVVATYDVEIPDVPTHNFAGRTVFHSRYADMKEFSPYVVREANGNLYTGECYYFSLDFFHNVDGRDYLTINELPLGVVNEELFKYLI